MKILDGKVAIVTGGGRGLGRSHAEALAAAGASVVVNDPGVSLAGEGSGNGPADEVVAAIRNNGGQAVANYSSCSDWKGAESLVDDAVTHFGRLDILVNNAGIGRDRMSYNMSEEEWDAVVDVNLKGHFAPSRAAGSYWREKAKSDEPIAGRIINTTSEAGMYGNLGQVNYGAAKAGILGMTFVLANELKKMGVTVNAISPRSNTRFAASIPGSENDPRLLEKTGVPGQVSPLVVYLASEAAQNITGQVFLSYSKYIKVLKGWEVAAEEVCEAGLTSDNVAETVGRLFQDVDSELASFSG